MSNQPDRKTPFFNTIANAIKNHPRVSHLHIGMQFTGYMDDNPCIYLGVGRFYDDAFVSECLVAVINNKELYTFQAPSELIVNHRLGRPDQDEPNLPPLVHGFAMKNFDNWDLHEIEYILWASQKAADNDQEVMAKEFVNNILLPNRAGYNE